MEPHFTRSREPPGKPNGGPQHTYEHETKAREHWRADRSRDVADREEAIAAHERSIVEQEESIHERQRTLVEEQQELVRKEHELLESERALRASELASREHELSRLEHELEHEGHELEEERAALDERRYLARREPPEEAEADLRSMIGGSMFAAGAGASAIALAIIGLAGAAPLTLAEIALIVAGAAAMILAAALGSRFRDLLRLSPPEHRSRPEVAGGATALAFGGAAAPALGILSLVGVAAGPLLSIGVITIGATLVLAAPSVWDLARLRPWVETERPRATRVSVRSAGVFSMVIGLGVTALGILALIGLATLPLDLIGLIGAGAALLALGVAVAMEARTMEREAQEARTVRRELPVVERTTVVETVAEHPDAEVGAAFVRVEDEVITAPEEGERRPPAEERWAAPEPPVVRPPPVSEPPVAEPSVPRDRTLEPATPSAPVSGAPVAEPSLRREDFEPTGSPAGARAAEPRAPAVEEPRAEPPEAVEAEQRAVEAERRAAEAERRAEEAERRLAARENRP